MMIVSMLMAVVLGMQYFEGTSRRSALNDEANLRFREGFRFALGHAIANITVPPDLLVTATTSNTTTGNEMASSYGAKIFERDKIPDITTGSNTSVPASTTLLLKPNPSLSGYNVFGSNTYKAVFSAVPGYAAYAPGGNVKITNLSGWANPHTGDNRPATQAYSGQSAIIAAKKDVTVDNVTFGEAHTTDGVAEIKKGEGAAFKDKQLPFPDYAAALKKQAGEARTALLGSTSGGDKTASFYGPAIGPELIIGMFTNFKGTLEGLYSMANSQLFFLPTVPTFADSPPYLYQIDFHMPYPPDSATYPDSSSAGDTAILKAAAMIAANVAAVAAQANLAAAEAFFAANPINPAAAAQLAEATAAWAAAEATVTGLGVYLSETAKNFEEVVGSKLNAGQVGVPPSRSVESPLGAVGWCFNPAQVLVPKIATLILSHDMTSVLNLAGNAYVSLVHFGTETRLWKWGLTSSSMSLDATVTVPRGRTLKLSSPSITINGDLWLQRGSVFYADTDTLTILPGRDNDGSLLAPKGRIFLEEGASLVCRGDLICKGDSRLGSVVTCGLPDKVHPLTASIYARNVTLENGIYSGTVIDDFLAGMADSEMAKLGTDVVRPMFDRLCPNVAKMDGPFHKRAGYFAKWATTFLIILTPMPPVAEPGEPVVMMVPLPVENMMNGIAESFGLLYQINLNLSLGENFFTSTDWWSQGEGSVPVFTNIETSKASSLQKFSGRPQYSINPEPIITGYVTTVVGNFASMVVEQVVEVAVEKIALKAVPYASIFTTIADAVLDVVKVAADELIAIVRQAAQLKTSDFDQALSGIASTSKRLADLQNTSEPDTFMKDYSGVFVNADDALTVSGKVATGMFVAGNRLTMKADQCVGTLLCHNGDIECKSLLYFPFFNQCSSYVPKGSDQTLWLERAKDSKYAADAASDKCVNVGPPPLNTVLTAQGWTQ